MKLPAAVVPYWEGVLSEYPDAATSRLLGTEYFGDNEKDADELAELVLNGVKRGTAPLLWSYQFDGHPLPEPGCLTIVINWQRQPRCVVRTTQVDIVSYQDVSPEFAAIEGEGDGSLEYWRKVHWPYYQRECERVGNTPTAQMPVLCHRFSRIYP